MNKKGLTLVELIAVLTILAMVALIVTPNIMVSIKQYQQQLYDTEISALESAAKNWTADNIDKINSDTNGAVAVGINELTNGGYYDADATDPKGGKFDDNKHFTFVIITCEVIEDKYHVIETNYKYKYDAYSTKREYIEKKALEYVKALNNNGYIDSSDFENSVYTKRVRLSDLLEPSNGMNKVNGFDYIKNNILYFDGTTNNKQLTLPNNVSVDVTVTRKGKNNVKYEYEVKKYNEA